MGQRGMKGKRRTSKSRKDTFNGQEEFREAKLEARDATLFLQTVLLTGHGNGYNMTRSR